MKGLLLALLGIIAYAGVVNAGDDACLAAKDLVYNRAPLPRVRDAIAKGNLQIVVLGTASSTLPGPTGERAAFPARLETALIGRLPGISVKVTPAVLRRKTAAEMTAEDFDRIAMDEKPALVIWQTGTVDAMRGVEPEEFAAALDSGIEALHEKGADVVLMNMQYSPRTESVIATATYAEDMRWAAIQREVPLFDRLAIMKHWSELGIFDLYDAKKNPDVAERVHDCIGRLLAELVVDAIKPPGTGKPEEIQ